MEGLKVVSAKTLHISVGGFTDDGGEVVVGASEEIGEILGQRHGRHGS